jgi:hypothetical protein
MMCNTLAPAQTRVCVSIYELYEFCIILMICAMIRCFTIFLLSVLRKISILVSLSLLKKKNYLKLVSKHIIGSSNNAEQPLDFFEKS